MYKQSNKSNLKIGFLLLRNHPGRGGLENVLIKVTDQLKKHDIDSYIYALHQPKFPDFSHYFDNFYCIKLPKRVKNRPKYLPKFIHNLIVKKYLKDYSTRIAQKIIDHKLDALIVLELSKQFNRYYSDINFIKQKANIPIISWPHGTLSHTSKRIQKRIYDKISIFDAHFSISDGITREFKTLYNQNNITTLYNPIKTASLIKRNSKKFIYIGRIDDNKRVYELINIIAQLTGDFNLDIIGSTGNKKDDQLLKKYLIDNHLVDRINFHGWQENPWAYITEAGALLLHSKSEGLPLALIEAMMRGIPCIAADCPTGPADIIQPNVNGWLYNMDDEGACLNILQTIIDGKLKLPDQVKVQESVQKFSKDRVIKNFADQLKKIVENNQSQYK